MGNRDAVGATGEADLGVELFVGWFLAAYFTGVAGFYAVTILRQRRRAGGLSPVIRGEPGSLHARVHQTFVVFRALIWLVAVVRLAYPAIDSWLLPIRPLWQPAVLLGGVALLVAAFAAVVLIHRAMGQDWRSGVDRGGPVRLRTDGAFAHSRNPTFIAIQIAQLGLFLAIPSVFTLVCLVVGVTAIHVQVRLEEAHLAARFGAAYAAYRAQVPRWLWPLPRRAAATGGTATIARTRRPPAG